VDSGWGGAHVTLTKFSSYDEKTVLAAFADFKKKWYANSKSADRWRPGSSGQGSTSFEPQQHTDGWRGMGIKSNMLDYVHDTLASTAFQPLTKPKDKWHITLASVTGKTFSADEATFKEMVQALYHKAWSLVLVKVDKEDGKLVFHRKSGFFVGQHDVDSKGNPINPSASLNQTDIALV